jgi:CDGSH-type Zn-finger protein
MNKKNIITPIKNGPLYITGELILKNGEGEIIEKTDELYLCRCSHSNNKPYCDGEHKKITFLKRENFSALLSLKRIWLIKGC